MGDFLILGALIGVADMTSRVELSPALAVCKAPYRVSASP
jgi:hypothetical protein